MRDGNELIRFECSEGFSEIMESNIGRVCLSSGRRVIYHIRRSQSSMKHLSFYLAVWFLVVLSSAIMLDPLASHGQSKSGGQPGADAAKRNASLSASLIWTFGGKQQHGWYLYAPLIKQT